LKNQTFYHQAQNENLWDNPTHAGPKTWRQWHGPKSRSDAALMERLDREDQHQAEWEAKKVFVNTSRVGTLDRLAKQCVVNDEKQVATSWAPNRRPRREVHDSLDRLGAELDSMSLKELKKVLTPQVLHADREAVRMITRHVQQEETWKEAWRNFELDRRDGLLTDLEHRQAYNAMLQEMSGQLPRPRKDPRRHLPNSCTKRVEHLAMPKQPRHHGDVTQLSDYRGLIHVDHDRALEARHRGTGHQLATSFREAATESSRPSRHHHRAATPVLRSQHNGSTLGDAMTLGASHDSQPKLSSAEARVDDNSLISHSVEQVTRTASRYGDARSIRTIHTSSVEKAVESARGLTGQLERALEKERGEVLPTLASVTGEIDAFESSMQVVPRLGNFWMPDEGRSEHLCQFVARVSGASPCAASVIDCAL